MKRITFVSVVVSVAGGLLSGCATHQPAAASLASTPVTIPVTYEDQEPEREIAAAMSPEESAEHYAQWGAVTQPTDEPTTIIGGYTNGCIAGAKPLPLKSPNYIVMHSSKHAYYGDPSMIRYLKELAEKAHGEGLPPLMIEDISHPRGGPVPKGHGSHQVGLDADVSLTMATRDYSAEEIDSFIAPSFVIDRKNLKPSWTENQTKLVALAATNPNVNRIFVSPAIKKYFCSRFENAPWLYKIRPWWEHEDHMHIRLNCPPNAALCRHQAALDPKTNPCGKDLEWWLSASADAEAKAMENSTWKRPFPKLPAQCEELRKR